MLGRAMLPLALFGLLLSGCGALPGDALEAARIEETLRLEVESSAEGEVWAIASTMTEVAPTVWFEQQTDDSGGRSTGYMTTSLEGLQWLAEHVWAPELERLQESRATAPPEQEAAIALHVQSLQSRFLMLDGRLERAVATLDSPGTVLSCIASANASASATTAATGAKSYSNARTCTFGEVSEGEAHAYSDPSGGQTQQYWNVRPGVQGSASAVRYGFWCWSAAWASGPPLYAEKLYFCP